LAEVLITLGIIGVVAAITMPMFVAHYQKHVLKNQFKAAYSILNQAVASAVQDNGTAFDCWYWNKIPKNPDGSLVPEYGNGRFGECTAFYNAFLSKLKVVSVCERTPSNKCAPDYKGKEVVNYNPDKSEAEIMLGCPDLTSSTLQHMKYNILSNGMILAKYSLNHFLVDTNGAKGPNKWGYDVFMFIPELYGSNTSGSIYFGGAVSACTLKEEGGFTIKEILQGK